CTTSTQQEEGLSKNITTLKIKTLIHDLASHDVNRERQIKAKPPPAQKSSQPRYQREDKT
ncbi:hypothetical protein ACV334_36275, partial [Pseudomonas aeruginosa]